MEGDVVLEVVDEVLEAKVDLVLDVRDVVCMLNDVQLLLDVRNNKLTVNGNLKPEADDKLDDVDLVDEVIHETERVDVLIADVSEIPRQNLDVVDVNLSRIVNDVVVNPE